MLFLRAVVMAADGDPDSALAACAVTFRIASHVKREPSLISQVVAYGMESTAVRALEEVLARSRPSPHACLLLEAQLATIDEAPSLVRAFRGEPLLFGLPAFEERRRKSRSGPLGPAGGSLSRILLDLDEAAYLHLSRQAIELAPLPYRDSYRRLQDLDASEDSHPFPLMLTAMLVPSASPAVAGRDRAQAKIGLARVALAASAFSAEGGHLPASLHELETAGWVLPADPFSGQAFGFRSDSSGITIWSIGSDLNDDNGRPVDGAAVAAAPVEERSAIREDSDIVFHIPASPSTSATSGGSAP